MKATTLLKNIGFTDKDAKVYVALLKLGDSNIKSLVDETNLPRSTIYTRIKKLYSLGAVEVFQKKRTKYYIAVTPEKLINIVKNNTKELEDHIDIFRNTVNAAEPYSSKIKLFEGEEGIKLILNDIVDESRPFLAIVSIDDMARIARDHFELFIERRIEKRLSVRLITNKTRESETLRQKDDEERRITRFVPSQYDFRTATYIYGDKIAMLSLNDKPVLGLIIEDASMANTHRMYFEALWANLK